MRIPTDLQPRDYSLTGRQAAEAVANGLAEADWYQTPVPRDALRALLERRNGPAVRDTLVWFALLGLSGWATWACWGTWWVVLPYAIYAVLYATASDSRWHECSHGTAFATDWLNQAVYELASFMVMRESVLWRWSHTRHHSDTIIVGRDPEIQVPRPTRFLPQLLGVANLGNYVSYPVSVVRHALGRITPAEATYVPVSEVPRIVVRARIILALHAAVVAWAALAQSWVPIFLVILPHLFGTWLMMIHNTTQHAGLAENVLDHRLNCRTVYMNPISRFIYWNMNYHVEHHMFPLVPYHALPRLHALIQHDCPPAYPSIWAAWKEILPALRRQALQPDHVVQRPLPVASRPAATASVSVAAAQDAGGWIEVGGADDLACGDVRRVDVGRKTYAIVRDAQGALFAMDGICTHGNSHLAEGFVKDGIIECPKHNGRFSLASGAPARAPVCRGVATYPIEARQGRLWMHAAKPGGEGARPEERLRLRVVAAQQVTPFIREIVLEPLGRATPLVYTPGDYLQIEIPSYGALSLADVVIPEAFRAIWQQQGVLGLTAHHDGEPRWNSYSIASNPQRDPYVRLYVRLALPPAGQQVPPGMGSTYLHHVRPGDEVAAIGPLGDFHPKPSQREMVYVGAGAGVAPLQAHVSYLFESAATARKVSLFYGARSRRDLIAVDYFTDISKKFSNFTYHPALSQPLPGDGWHGSIGHIHEVALTHYLQHHPQPRHVEFYLCGPPAMVADTTAMLLSLGVPPHHIAADEF